MAVCGRCRNVHTQGLKDQRQCVKHVSLYEAMICDTMKMNKKKEKEEKGGNYFLRGNKCYLAVGHCQGSWS